MRTKLCHKLSYVATLITILTVISNAHSSTGVLTESDYFSAVAKAEQCLQKLGFKSIRIPSSIKPMVFLEIELSELAADDEQYNKEVGQANRCLAKYLEPTEERFFEQLTNSKK